MPSDRRYLIEFLSCLAAYAVLLVLTILLLGPNPATGGPASLPASLIVLLPMIPATVMCWVVLRHLRRVDELQRRVQLEALGLAFAGTALITFSYGFLELIGFPKLSMFAVWPIMAMLWIIGGLLAGRRYR